MKLVKTAFFSAIITFIRIASGFVASKVVAIFTGPSGVALIGAFTNFISIALTFANGAINNGVVKYTAEYESDEQQLKTLFSTSLKISIYCSVFFGLVLIFFAPFLSDWILTNELYSNPIRVLGGSIILYALNTLLVSILNGKKQIKTYTIVNTIGSLIGLIFTITLVYYYKIEGALYALVLAQSIVFFLTAALIVKSSWFAWSYFTHPFNKEMAKKLGGYSLMAIVSAITLPVAQIILRNIVIKNIGIDEAGYWQGMMRVSDGYLLLIITSLSTYYLPKLSSLKTDPELKSEILNGYKIILPTVFLGCVFIYFFRFLIIRILYTDSFLQMETLFLWQLLGDFFKIAAWVLSYLMLAKAMTKVYIMTEVLFALSYVFFGFLFVHYLGLIGITLAFAFNYLVYLIVMVCIFKKLLFGKNE